MSRVLERCRYWLSFGAFAIALIQVRIRRLMLSPPPFKRGKRPNSQTSPVSETAVVPKTSKSDATGRPKEVRTITPAPLRRIKDHQTIGRDWRAHPDEGSLGYRGKVAMPPVVRRDLRRRKAGSRRSGPREFRSPGCPFGERVTYRDVEAEIVAHLVNQPDQARQRILRCQTRSRRKSRRRGGPSMFEVPR